MIRASELERAPRYDEKVLASAVNTLSRHLREPSEDDGPTRLRRLAGTLEVLCQIAGDEPDLGAELADAWVRADSYLLAATDAADAGAPDSVTDGLLDRGRLEIADQLAELASNLVSASDPAE